VESDAIAAEVKIAGSEDSRRRGSYCNRHSEYSDSRLQRRQYHI
jgi:hypothetical protein